MLREFRRYFLKYAADTRGLQNKNLIFMAINTVYSVISIMIFCQLSLQGCYQGLLAS